MGRRWVGQAGAHIRACAFKNNDLSSLLAIVAVDKLGLDDPGVMARGRSSNWQLPRGRRLREVRLTARKQSSTNDTPGPCVGVRPFTAGAGMLRWLSWAWVPGVAS